ncbi:MAG: ribonuclease, partial [Oscillospiraceae bacterium]|nr:ribonuclease [Oscillospiraceae bacterium]
GTSVYFADSVVPMLPPALSNGACSLNPQADRLAFSALLKLDHDGALTDFRFVKTVIRSRVKGVYAEVNRILTGEQDTALDEKYGEVKPQLIEMAKLAKLLQKQRTKRGSLALTSLESKIKVDENGVAVDVLPRVQGEAERLIEELMLTANEAAATLALEQQLPFVFRVHETPAPEKLAMLKELLDTVGLPSGKVLPGVRPVVLSDILLRAQQTPYAVLINSAILRAMQKARYNEINLGHYGLALANYTHFTSPIRRYPDLAIHRILSGFVKGEPVAKLQKRFGSFAASASKQSSEAEVNAMGVERSCEDCYKAEYMSRHIGERFTGTVISAAAHGVYVQLENTVDGLVRTESLGEGMLYDGRMQYATADGKRRVRVGDQIAVIVAAAEVSTGRIDFALAELTIK